MTIHIVGLDVQVGTRLRQRCAWCGAIIDDRDLANERYEIPRPPPGVEAEAWTKTYATEAPVVRAFPVGELVEIGGSPSGGGTFAVVVEHRDGDRLPPECCAQQEDTAHAPAPG